MILRKQGTLKPKPEMLKKTTNNRRIAIMGITPVKKKEGVGGENSQKVAAEQTGKEDEKKSQDEEMESDYEWDSQAESSEL